MDMADRYATLIRTILLGSFYAPAMPVALLWSIVGLVLTYWADKVGFLSNWLLKFLVCTT